MADAMNKKRNYFIGGDLRLRLRPARRSLTGGEKGDAGAEEEPEEEHTKSKWVHLGS